MRILIIILLLIPVFTWAQNDPRAEVEKFQKELNEEFKDPKKTPLTEKARKRFKHHDFFPFDSTYRVEAELIPADGSPFFKMPTSNFSPKEYRVYGRLKFNLKGKQFEVPVYQSKQLMTTEEYKNYLFFPFTDLTNGKQTYANGRYISLSIPEAGKTTVVLDFNQAYNPFCAYSDKYSCPLVPSDNDIDLEILAGVKYSNTKKH